MTWIGRGSMTLECWHIISVTITSVQQLWIVTIVVELLSPQHTISSLQEGHQIWLRELKHLQIAGRSWSIMTWVWCVQDPLGVVLVYQYHCHVPIKYPPAVGNNVLPCFHLNTPFRACTRGLNFGLSREISTDCSVILEHNAIG